MLCNKSWYQVQARMKRSACHNPQTLLGESQNFYALTVCASNFLGCPSAHTLQFILLSRFFCYPRMLLHMTLPLHPPVQEEQSYSSDTPTLFKIRQKLSGRWWKSHFNWKYFNIQEIFRLKKNTNCSLCLAQINLCITRSTGIIFKVMVLLFSLISIHFCSLTLRCALKSSSDRLMTGSTLPDKCRSCLLPTHG